METRSETGRRLVLAVIVITVTLSVLVIVAYNTIIPGPEHLPLQIVRLLLTVGLCIFLYRGANWARLVAGILFAIGGVGSLLKCLPDLSTDIRGLLLIVIGLVWVASAVVLLFVPAARAYFRDGSAKTG